MSQKRLTTGILLALSAALLWGISGAVAAHAFAEVPPTRVAEARSLVAALVLVPYAWYRRRFDPGGRLWLLALIGVNLAANNAAFYWALDRLGVGPGATLQFLGPIGVLAWMRLVQKRPVHRTAWAAAILAVAGVALVTRAWDTAALDLWGLAAGLGAAVLFASYLLLGEKLGRDLPALTIIAWGFLFASMAWLIVQPVWSFPTDLSTAAWAELAWVGIGGTAVPFLAQFAALRRAPSGIIGVVATAEPVIAAITAWLWLEQILAFPQVVGGLMVVGAVAAIQRYGVAEFEVPYESAR